MAASRQAAWQAVRQAVRQAARQAARHADDRQIVARPIPHKYVVPVQAVSPWPHLLRALLRPLGNSLRLV